MTSNCTERTNDLMQLFWFEMLVALYLEAKLHKSLRIGFVSTPISFFPAVLFDSFLLQLENLNLECY